MLEVFFTTDVEVWCDGWKRLDAEFPDAFRRYVYGPTAAGEVGLRHQCQLLGDHGLRGVFFVEPMFSGRFGMQPLAEIVGILNDAAQEIQLHMHTEWMDEWPVPLLQTSPGKRQHLHQWTVDEQTALIAEGLRRLEQAGGGRANCFRAGSFGFNAATLDALASNGVPIDSSYNATAFGPESGVAPGRLVLDVECIKGVTEVPMTVYDPRVGQLRHVQLGACSSAEIERLLWRALEAGHHSFVILSHNFELLTPDKARADPVVTRRFRRLAAFLDRHRDSFVVRGFRAGNLPRPAPPRRLLRGAASRSAWRLCEQIYRRSC